MPRFSSSSLGVQFDRKPSVRLLIMTISTAIATAFMSLTCFAQEDMADLIERCEKSVVRIEVKGASGDSLGSGFVIDRNGTFVTNVHVLAGATSARAIFPNNQVFNVLGTMHLDKSRDIAIGRLEGAGIASIPPIKIATSTARKGERVVALGSPHGLSFTATSGVVSAIRPAAELGSDLGRSTMQGTWIQIDAALSPGNSGGPIINSHGEVVAMSTLASQGSAQNLNFGISAADILVAVNTAAASSLVSLPEGAGKIVMRERERRESEGIINPKEIPLTVIKSYVDLAKTSFKDLMREMRIETERLKTDLKEMRKGESYIPAGIAEADTEIVRMKSPSGRSRAWYFRSDSTKQREVSRTDGRVKELTKLTQELKDPNDNNTLLRLAISYGPKLDGRRNNSVGFMTDAIVLHAFNDHDALVLYNDTPYLIYLESTAGLSLGQEVAAVPVFVAGTATAERKDGATASFTVLQTVSEDELREAIFGQPKPTTPAPGSNQLAGSPTPSGPTQSTQPDAASSGLFAPQTESGMRTWYDRSGSFSVEAILLSADDKIVTLRKKDGQIIKVPRERLSDADQKYLSR